MIAGDTDIMLYRGKIHFNKTVKSLLVAGCLLLAGGELTGMSLKSYAVTIEYDNLRELLIEGNSDLKYSQSLTTVKNLDYQLKVLREEAQSLAANGRIYSDDTETSSQYKSSAAVLTRTIDQLERQLEKQTSDTASINSNADSLTMSAQSTMISYLQMQENADAMQKKAEAAEVKYNNAVTRQAAGTATDSDVTDAHTEMINAQSQALSYKQQAADLRRTLLDLLGITDGEDVTIASLPDPDITAIEAIDHDTDKQLAVDNDSTVKSVRHGKGSSSANMEIKDANEEAAVGNAEASYEEAYLAVKNGLEEYYAAQKGLAVAEQNYQSLQRKKSAGMLTTADELSGESDYISAKSQYETAKMSLIAAYENYKWMLKGYSGSSSGGAAGGPGA